MQFSRILTIALFTFCLLPACKWLSRKDNSESPSIKDKNISNMPIPELPTISGDYYDDWKMVDSLEGQGLPKSALERVERIEKQARADQNHPQVVKTLLFRAKYNTQIEEDGIKKGIQILEEGIAKASDPSERAVLQSHLGSIYAQYLSVNRWSLQDRTPVTDEGGDILTWSAKQIQTKALNLYVSSVQPDPKVLAQPTTAYRDAIVPGLNDSLNGQALRPGLYDLLCHRAVEFFQNDVNFLSEPTYAFVLNQPEAFAQQEAFAQFDFPSQDSSSNKWLALRTFQQLLRTAAQEKNIGRIVDADLERLRFVHAQSSLTDKDTRMAEALQALLKSCAGHPVEADVMVEAATRMLGIGSDKERVKNTLAAVEMLETATRLYPGTPSSSRADNLLSDIRRGAVDCIVEDVNYPEKPILVSISYKNMDRVWIRVVRKPMNEVWRSGTLEEREAFLQKAKPLQEATWAWDNPRDYQSHRTEIALKGLPPGEYMLLVADNAAFSMRSGILNVANFSVSRIALRALGQGSNTATFVAADRMSGQPLADVKVEMHTNLWQGDKYQKQLIGSVQTNQQGIAQGTVPMNSGVVLRAVLAGDSVWCGSAYGYERGSSDATDNVHFFTDRVFYRPGQSVYFKGVAYRNDPDGKPVLLPNRNVSVRFMDANDQEKAKLNLRTNEYGTINGVFTAPTGGLTGSMSIQADGMNGGTYFNVEEYKRPKFEVKMQPITGSYRVGDALTVSGVATNFAGSAVDGAEFKYRVVRTARLPYFDFWRYGRGGFPYNQQAREIAFGTAKTDENGGFEIKFKAEPDLDIPKKELPVFHFEVYVDVTDISGETQSVSSTVDAGYAALNVDWALPAAVHVDSLRKVAIAGSNAAGQPLAVKGDVTFQRLVSPKQAYESRFWDAPDVKAIEKNAFLRDFPLFAWDGEDDPLKWGRVDYLIPFAFDSEKSKTTDLHQGKVPPGHYVAVLQTKDAFGEPIRIEKVVRVFDDANQFEKPATAIDLPTAKPGQKATLRFGSDASQHFFYVVCRQDTRKVVVEHTDARNVQAVTLPIGEDDRGGLSYHWWAVRNNRSYGEFGYEYVNVPWSDKELTLTYETFRDKLAPGQKEEWRVRISGPKKEKVAAEMVATLYDASLDQFAVHTWNKIAWPGLSTALTAMNGGDGFGPSNGSYWRYSEGSSSEMPRRYPRLDAFGFTAYYGGRMLRNRVMLPNAAPAPEGMAMEMEESSTAGMDIKMKDSRSEPANYYVDGVRVSGEMKPVSDEEAVAPPASLRQNLKETVFFLPDLHTDANGDILIKFTMNEALTRWKFMAFGHTKSLQQVISTREVVTQKELMVLPNTPRFLRAGDAFEFSAKVSNLSQEALEGTVSLALFDAATMRPINDQFGLNVTQMVQKFAAKPGQSAPATWMVRVPEDFTGAVTWRIFAESKSFRDGEESTLPVVTNRMLVTETLPIALRGNQKKSFTFDALLEAKGGGSLQPHQYTVEFSSNPVWYAVQALPYLMEYPHECSEQVFSRFYANTLASSVTERMPAIKRVYERWKATSQGDAGAMASNLSKNQELKYALLEETPWVMDAQNEAQQKQQIALLFDLNRMANEREKALQTLASRQDGSTGGWPWFPGGEPSWSITQQIYCGFKHLEKLGAFDASKDQTASQMMARAGDFCYAKLMAHYANLEKEAQAGRLKMEDDHLDGLVIQALYAASFNLAERPSREMAYYFGQAEKYWLGKGIYQEGLIALALHRSGNKEAATRITNSLRERAIVKEELGMYWPAQWGYFWYQLPIETQALMVEVFHEVANDSRAVEDLRIWLLKNKQTNRWESTKATAEAVYALLLGDGKQNPWLDNTKPVQVALGGKAMKLTEVEAGTGYFKQQWAGSEVKSSWAEIKVENPNNNIVWGAAYWQYFEDLDKIKTFQKTPLTIVKQLYTEENTANGPLLKPVAEGQSLKRGTKIKVRIEIRVDRDMEFVHLKDMRAAGFEPLNVLSGYRWQGGLGYYESTKDLATHFFIDYLPRGTFVLEYPLVVSHRGDMSNGITTMQCMYAPEFTSHSKGIRVRVE